MKTKRLLLCFCLLVMAPMVFLGWYGYSNIEMQEKYLKSEQSGIFLRAMEKTRTSIEARFNALLREEENRPFDQYSTLCTTVGMKNNDFIQTLSPLADIPKNDWIIGYYQVEPTGEISTPAWNYNLDNKNLYAQLSRNADINGYSSDSQGQDRLNQRINYGCDFNSKVQGQSTQIKDIANQNSLPPDMNTKVPRASVYGSLNGNQIYNEQQKGNDEETSNVYQQLQKEDEVQENWFDASYSRFALAKLDDSQYCAVRRVELKDPMHTLKLFPVQLTQGFVLNQKAIVQHLWELLENVSIPDAKIVGAANLDHESASLEKFDLNISSLPEPFALYLVEAKTDGSFFGKITQSKPVFLGFMATLFAFMVGGMWFILRAVNQESALNAKKGDFLSAVTHELKTPLAGIRLHAELLRENMIPAEAKKRECYNSILSESERLSRLITGILDLTNIEKGRKTYDIRDQSLAMLAQQVCGTYRERLQKEGFSFELRVEDNLPNINIDRDAVTQILQNLLDNASKYSTESPEKSIEVILRKDGKFLSLGVRDKGIGIPESEQDLIYEKFYRVQNEQTRKTQGTGIGLSLVKEFIYAHNGKLRLSSKPGQGSFFEVLFPI